MGIGVLVYGYIECPGYGFQAADRRIHHHNRRVLDRLPDSDPDWPFLTRQTFAIQPLRPTLERQVPQYEIQAIHFAASYKNMYVLEADWLRKFENLLAQLCWYSAVVMLEFSGLRYEWSVDIGSVAERYHREPPLPPTEWQFQCHRFDKTPLGGEEAIDGPFESRGQRSEDSRAG